MTNEECGCPVRAFSILHSNFELHILCANPISPKISSRKARYRGEERSRGWAMSIETTRRTLRAGQVNGGGPTQGEKERRGQRQKEVRRMRRPRARFLNPSFELRTSNFISCAPIR